MGVAEPHVYIVCDLSILGQWATEVRRLHSPAGLQVDLLNYNQFEKMTANDDFVRSVRKADLFIVDECQIFRNLSPRMLRMISVIRSCPRVLLLSGTIVVNDAEDALGFQQLCVGNTDGTLAAAAKGRVAFYDPALMPASAKFYPKVKRESITVEMTFQQTLLYLSNRTNDFKLPLGGGDMLRVQRPVQNRYGTALQSAANLPFIDRPETSPKLMALVNNVIKLKKNGSQVIYSSRIERGVDAILKLLQRSGSSLRIEKVDGQVAAAERTRIVKAYNSGLVDCLIISPASARGIDLMKTYAFHLLEVHQNVSEEQQTLTRAVRYKSHMGVDNPVVHVFQYLAKFPSAKPSKTDVQETLEVARNTFGPEQCEGVSADKLIAAIRTECKKTGDTIDEAQAARNIQKHIEVERCLKIIRSASIPMPLAEAAGIEKVSAKSVATPTKIRNTIDDWTVFSSDMITRLRQEQKLSEAKAKKAVSDSLKEIAEREEDMRGQDFTALISTHLFPEAVNTRKRRVSLKSKTSKRSKR
jgi:Helicase conserved C-terminal domain